MILFLDFDGVLHHENVTLKPCHPLAQRQLTPAERSFLTHDGKLASGDKLFEHAARLTAILAPFPHVKIVISSSWREHFRPDKLLSFLPDALALRVIGQNAGHDSQIRRYQDALGKYWKQHGARQHYALVDARSMQVAWGFAMKKGAWA